MKDLKFDYELVSDLQGKTITLGDLVAHSISLNKAEQLLSTFSVLLDKDPRTSLTSVTDVSYGATSTEPLIADYDSMVRLLSNLLKVRHILVHEVPRQKVYSPSEVLDFLDTAYAFCYATEETVLLELFGTIPRTQREMNVAAYEEQQKAEGKMESALGCIRQKVTERGAFLSGIYADRENVPEHFKQSAEEWLELLEQSQTTWLQYRDKYSEFESYLNKTGTIYPMRISSSRASMTNERAKELEGWLEFDRKLYEL